MLACKAELGRPEQAGNNASNSGGSGSNQQPTTPDSGSGNNPGTAGGTASGGSTSSSSGGSSGSGSGTTSPDQSGQPTTETTQPAPPTSLDLAGALPLTHEQGGQFDIQLCADKVCVTQSAQADGSFGFKLKLSQWPQDKALRLVASHRQNSGLSLSSELPALTQLLKQDQNGDGIITEQESPRLHLSPMPLAYQSIMAALQKQEGKQDVSGQLFSDPHLNHRFARDLTALLQLTLNGDMPNPAQQLSALATALVSQQQSNPTSTLFAHLTMLATSQGTTLPDDAETRLNDALAAMEKLDTRTATYKLLTTFYPQRQLTLLGQFPSRLSEASVSVEIGANPNHDGLDAGYYFKPERPIRPQRLAVMAQSGRMQESLPIEQGNQYNITLTLADLNNSFASCKPGSSETSDDLMEDTLTLVVQDAKSEVELRSVLGSFCELVKRDENRDGMLGASEYPRLNVGYTTTAQWALLLKSTLNPSTGSAMSGWQAWTLDELTQKFNALPRHQLEMLAAMIALQAEGELWNQPVNLIEGSAFHLQLLSWLEMNMTNEYGLYGRNNVIPDIFKLQSAISDNSGLGPLFNVSTDKNISHLLKDAAAFIRNSETDAPLYPSNSTPGNWITLYPNSPIAPVCQQEVLSDQVIGLAILGQGKERNGNHWVTLGWLPQAGVSRYQIGWGETPFTRMDKAGQLRSSEQTRITLNGLQPYRNYQIRVMSEGGTISAPLSYRAGQLHVADTRITHSMGLDDGKRGRDLDSRCDPLSGQAVNSNLDGVLGARYIKLDNRGEPLPRQDLSYKQMPFACVADALSGLVWETKVQHKDGESSLHDDKSLFAYDDIQSNNAFNGSCYDPQSGALASDRSRCNLKRQISQVNQSKLCGLSNWRAPSQQEFYGIMTLTRDNPIALDTRYFPLYSGLQYTYGKWQELEGIFYGFWTSDVMPVSRTNSTWAKDDGGPDAYEVRPDTQLRGSVARQYQPHYVMLVSDGFKVTGE
ncbi:fibronectin type III domain-containing protein [Aeromonas sp. HMWF015]|uniref:fibronectin type III domain-containing protein n=1 Tax=Aeromonas sp. HMWF015 TaxID=2056851 RepID=UPI002159C78D|nr:fibronectin type III domain-containing protein [Aeromonas sp. HMWF015]